MKNMKNMKTMKIIDAHMHFSKISSFGDCAYRSSDVDYSAAGYGAEAKACGIVRSVCMGLFENPPSVFPDKTAATPMLADLSDQLPPGIALCPGINPHTLNAGAMRALEDMLDNAGNIACKNDDNIACKYGDNIAGNIAGKNGGNIAGVKIYAGYYHFDVNDPVYAPVYDFAERHDLPVVIHSGDTYSDKGLLVYAQPLSIDALAVGRPGMRIVLCHMGAPWVFDACEVVGKNDNVYMDLSGLLVGNAEYFARMAGQRLLLDRYRQALIMLDNYDKVLFGTDWPLAPMASYIDFCRELVPPEEYEKVFYGNAAKVFNLS